MNQKYGVNFTYVAYNGNTKLDSALNEYQFGAGTTMWAVLSAIGKKNNMVCEITSFANNDTSNITYTFIPNSERNNAFINSNKLLSVSYNQTMESYCKYLETEAQNVVDRANEVTFRNLSVRGDIVVNHDNCKLLLPTNVEAITHFYVDLKFTFDITIDNAVSWIWIRDHGGTLDNGVYSLSGRLDDFINNTDDGITNDEGKNIIYAVLEKEVPAYFDGKFSGEHYGIEMSAQPPLFGSIHIWMDRGGSTVYPEEYFYLEQKVDMINVVAEENYWNTLAANDKSKYAVYKSGGNEIYNLNATYKKDFINGILGISTGNFLESNVGFIEGMGYHNDARPYTYSVTIKPLKYQYDAEKYKYDVTCIPMINLKLEITKKIEPLNETSYKPLTRTYNNSSSIIDFNLLAEDMRINTATLGRIELTLELDVTDEKLSWYKANNSVTYNNRYWYIQAVEYTFTKTSQKAVLYLNEAPQKIADAIGVDYQFEPTAKPINNIITRPLYYEYKANNPLFNSYYDKIKNQTSDVFIRIFGSSGAKFNLVKRAVVMVKEQNIYENEYLLLYCEALDQYAFDKQVMADTYPAECRDISYCDSNNEIAGLTLDILISNASYDSNKLPLTSALGDTSNYIYIPIVNNRYIYKDARERLTFTIKITKS